MHSQYPRETTEKKDYEIKEIKIPAQPLTNIKNIYGPSVTNSNISDFFIWINDEDIAYVSQNHYYNQGGIYVYNITIFLT